ncbi:helix-turn-helix domain-containing protein [Nonomuraea sp. NPDC004702]
MSQVMRLAGLSRRVASVRTGATVLAARFPHVRVDPAPVFVRDGMVTYLERPGDQAQVSMCNRVAHAGQVLVRRVVDHVVSHLDEDLGVARPAALAGVSERHLSRLFVECVGRTPSRPVRETRLEAAVQLLTGTREPVAAIARRCGLSSAESSRRAFVAWAGVRRRVSAGDHDASVRRRRHRAPARGGSRTGALVCQPPALKDLAPLP